MYLYRPQGNPSLGYIPHMPTSEFTWNSTPVQRPIPPPPPPNDNLPRFSSPTGHLYLNASLVGNNNSADNSSSSAVPSAMPSTSSPPLNVNASSSTSSLPTFQPPAPGQLLITQATITMGEYKRSIPVLYYTSKDSTHKYVYPFTRSLIGTVWHTSEQLERCEFHHIHEPDSIKFCARRADLPVEMIQQLLVALEQNRGGANLDTPKLAAWHADLRNPEERFTTGIPYMQCRLLNHVHLCDIIHLYDISNGMACKHIEKDCVRDKLHINPSNKPSNPRPTQPPASATNKPEYEPMHSSSSAFSSSSSSHPMNRTWPHMQHAQFMN